MTRNKYCDVCGTEFRRGRSKKRKQKDQSKPLKAFGKVLQKKLTISILAALILIIITVPAVCVPLTRRAQSSGEITLITISINTLNSDSVHLHLTMKVVSGSVRIDKIHLHSYDQQKRYQSMIVKQDFHTGYFMHQTFLMPKGQLEDMNHGFSLLIDYRYGKQWIRYFFG